MHMSKGLKVDFVAEGPRPPSTTSEERYFQAKPVRLFFRASPKSFQPDRAPRLAEESTAWIASGANFYTMRREEGGLWVLDLL
ncbi:hypothetical protein KEM54_002894 [Ascosphaera aggregata]|nr:hypothetical protein KEM54_002894 [Ascosphaera aggregata]